MRRQLDFDLLRTFVAIAETRTLGRAANKIGRTQAAVSMQVKKLEEMLAQPLLNRTGRGVVLTLHGERLLGHARTILRQHDAAVADISGTGLVGTLRFGCPDDYAAAFLPDILRSFAGQHPQVFVEVICAPTPRLLEQLAKHALDLALVSTTDTNTESNGTTSIMRREPLVWVGSRHDLAATHEPLKLALSDPDTLDARRGALRPGHRGADAIGGAPGSADPRTGRPVAELADRRADGEIRPAAATAVGGAIRRAPGEDRADVLKLNRPSF